ncbi:PKD domain-containing protein, partial [Candidatus Gracilibacteria bacterium]|nr:PKD domain-containing protein [Candidatus Gracilibacteria bacterium]
MFKKIILIFLLFILALSNTSYIFATENEPVYTKFRLVDAGTFNEYRYKITEEFFNLRNKYEIDGSIDTASAKKILDLAKKGYNYLPDSLSNKNYYNYLKSSVVRAIKYPNNSTNYTSLASAIENFLDKTNIQAIKGTVEAFPKEGNAPLNVTLRGNVRDPSGTKIPRYNYVWWMQEDGKRKILGNGISLNHIFRDEGNYAIFLDVRSDHKNKKGYTDVLSFSGRADIKIKEKVASIILKVNSTSLRNKDVLKFTPDDARYGLLFDATSSTPTAGTKFIKTSWDFGNGITKTYDGGPKVERVIYPIEGEYNVVLKLQTNELKTIERKFKISIHDPIATINVNTEEGYLGDKFTFSSQKTGNDKNLSFSWEIIDLNNDKVIFRKAGTLFTYVFKNKGKYNVKMKVSDASGKTDIDTKIIYINSRAPVADFTSKIPFSHKPNKVFFDATKSYDPDYSDDGKLKYNWIINGNRVKLNEPNYNGSTGYFTFDSVGEHSVTLEVVDPDSITSIKKSKVVINSILSVEFFAFPRVVQREKTIRFVSSSPQARFFEWDFGDGIKKGGKDANISHAYKKSGIYKVKLQVRDVNDNINSFTKNVYIGESDRPYSFIGVTDDGEVDVPFDETACDGKGAYIVNRVDTVTFSGKESINITGETTGLTYSWKLGRDTYKNTNDFTKKFDELGCYPIKLTVKSDENGRTDSTTSYVEVKNIKPTLSSLDVRVVDPNTDPVIVNVNALGAKDRDGIIQSYLWYYYTDIDSEPQDFRATKTPSTSFVLPKVTGNYYFVVIMKDNNEAKSNSEEITGSKYFMTLTGDNLNTPLVSLKVDDSTVSIGDEITFTANVENILGQDLSHKVKYSWDFDGDGFYDKQTTKNSVSYKFLSSGKKHTKVKAKYKGFSNTKTITINVSNILKPDFGYISIGNKFKFFYDGIGKADTYEWDLGDKTIISNKKYFEYEYKDGKPIHIVTLKISEGTKVKSIKKKVVKNFKNLILSRKDGLIVFSSPKVDENNQIVLENKRDNIFLYLGGNKKEVSNFVIDNDIKYDSNINGVDDDDEDNKGLSSYTDGGIIKVKLNDNKFQNFRVYTKDKNGNIIDSKDITIVKNYIEQEEIDINSIVFNGVSDDIKLKIEKLKNYVDGLPKEYKLKASMYVQKLQEEWSDNREKTNIILEFEGYIYETGVKNADEIVNLLEGLLVENQNDKSDKAIAYNALKNLIPTSIVCKDINTGTEIACYDKLIAKLDVIKSNSNIDENKALGTEILKVIADDKVMTAKEKTDFKAILKTFVYGGVANIPKEEKQVVEKEATTNNGDLINLIYTVFKWIAIIIFVLLGFIVLFYIYYKIDNKDPNIGFQDFIIDKTSGEKGTVKKEVTSVEDDIFADLQKESEKKEDNIENNNSEQETKKVDPLFGDNSFDKKTNNEEKAPLEKSDGDVPSWLKGTFDEVETKGEIKENKQEEKDIIKQEENIKENVKKEEIKEENSKDD